jgi:hypothetical protein
MCQPTTTYRRSHLIQSSIARHHQVTIVFINPCQKSQKKRRLFTSTIVKYQHIQTTISSKQENPPNSLLKKSAAKCK